MSWAGHFVLLLRRLGLALLLAELCRLLFFVFNAPSFAPYGFNQVIRAFYYGLLFDLSAIAYFNILFVLLSIMPLRQRSEPWYQLLMKGVFIVCNSLSVLLNVIDVEYFKFSAKRSGAELFQNSSDISAVLADYIVDYWYLLLPLALFIFLLYKLYPALPKKEMPYGLKQYLQQSALMLFTAGGWIIAARGGFYLKPLRPFDATRFVKAELLPLTVNTPFQFISTIDKQLTPAPVFFNPADAERIAAYKKNADSGGLPFNKKNVFIIILESFGKEYVGFYNQGKGYTPFLDSLCRQSLVFTHAFANGKKSIEALPSILSSMPSLLEVPFINSPYQSNRLSSIGKLLQEETYQSAFYHGAQNGTMSFDGYIGASGFGAYYGLNEYPVKSDFDGHWGIFDEPYLQYVAAELEHTREPFCAAVFTLSSHHPYPIPDKYKGRFPEGHLEIHASIGYTDFALKQFFKTAAQKAWYKNTVFLLTADHSALNAQLDYQSMAGKFAVPMLLFDPSAPAHLLNHKTVSHADIMPTLLHYLHYPKAFNAFGQSALDSSSQGYAFHYDNGVYQLISMPYVLHFDGQKSIAAFNYRDDPRLLNNILTTMPAASRDSLEQKLKAEIQVYYSRLNSNSLLK